NRKKFIELIGLSSGVVVSPSIAHFAIASPAKANRKSDDKAFELNAQLIIAGGGVGACAAALAALRNNLSVIMTEETDWIGGQLTQQGVPPDEHPWIETHGATALYRSFRKGVREYYKNNYPLTQTARAQKYLNPGDGVVSELCHEPKVSLTVLQAMLSPYLSNGTLTILLEHKIVSADVNGDEVKALKAVSKKTGKEVVLSGRFFIDGTELGDLLPLTGTEYVTGTESKKETGELHAPEVGDPDNVQAFTVCFAMDYVAGANHTIDKPAEYSFWSNYVPNMTPAWPGRLLQLMYPKPATLVPTPLGFHPEGLDTGKSLNLWNYRRIISKDNFRKGSYAGDISSINWPQNDYTLGNLIGATEKEFNHHVDRAKGLSLSLLYWLQTEAPRPNGGYGWPGLRLRKDMMGTEDGLAKYPYIREARRIKALFTVKEEHVGVDNRALVYGKAAAKKSADFYDSVGVGSYHIDLHPSTRGNNYIDFNSLPFQIPLGALVPQRMINLMPVNKNIGTTHITNGCYRLHPVEWSIGEAVGLLTAYAIQKKVPPKEVREKKELLQDFQNFIRKQGVETKWPV
ncbi:MAG TPA: FAD-dependent oxidoreductase, partial [Chitinophagaceae bacterium]|nr:FAD-dependent oxidoreductase [Chitinophagaceae bacterium]